MIYKWNSTISKISSVLNYIFICRWVHHFSNDYPNFTSIKRQATYLSESKKTRNTRKGTWWGKARVILCLPFSEQLAFGMGRWEAISCNCFFSRKWLEPDCCDVIPGREKVKLSNGQSTVKLLYLSKGNPMPHYNKISQSDILGCFNFFFFLRSDRVLKDISISMDFKQHDEWSWIFD